MVYYFITTALIVIICVVFSVRKHYKNKVQVISFKESMDLTELPIITFYEANSNVKLNFLLDTGANKNVINKSELKNIHYTETDKKTIVSGMEGNAVSSFIINICFNYKDNLYSSEFSVGDLQAAFDNLKKNYGVTVHGIIGSKFFEENKYVIDFSTLKVYIKK